MVDFIRTEEGEVQDTFKVHVKIQGIISTQKAKLLSARKSKKVIYDIQAIRIIFDPAN